MGWRFKGNEKKYVTKILDNDFSFKKSSMNERLEKLFSKVHKQKYAITCNSGTATLHSILNSFGVGHGDEVIIPSLTVAMCGFVVWQCGAVPVYADVNPKTFLIDPNDIEKKITKKTKAIMAVHIYGLMADMEKIMAIAKKNNLLVVEDCAQCYLATDSKGRVAGTVGDAASWSFEHTKHLSTGDGGIVTTSNKNLATKIRKFAGVGFKNITAERGKKRIDKDKFQNPNWIRHDMFAYNYRMPEICAAVGLAQTEKIKFFIKKRIEAGLAFLLAIKKLNSDLIIPQQTPKDYKHSYYTFACIFNGEKYGIKWQKFRKKFMEYGGDGIYAAWKTVNQEIPFLKARNNGLYSGKMKLSNSYGWGETPNAINIQKKIMQFTTNQKNKKEVNKQINALIKTINYFIKKN
jgi:perosamine synthetase